MFKEVIGKKDKSRRWFDGTDMELIVWFSNSKITGFQICYDKSQSEHALTWRNGLTFEHHLVDDGNDYATSNRTPILLPDGQIPIQKIIAAFNKNSSGLEKTISDFVTQKLATIK